MLGIEYSLITSDVMLVLNELVTSVIEKRGWCGARFRRG